MKLESQQILQFYRSVHQVFNDCLDIQNFFMPRNLLAASLCDRQVVASLTFIFSSHCESLLNKYFALDFAEVIFVTQEFKTFLFLRPNFYKPLNYSKRDVM